VTLRISHVEKYPYPERNFASSHWGVVELTEADLPTRLPAAQEPYLFMYLAAYAKYICLTAILADGLISNREYYTLLINFVPYLKALGIELKEAEAPHA
jgi:hypothetical protein